MQATTTVQIHNFVWVVDIQKACLCPGRGRDPCFEGLLYLNARDLDGATALCLAQDKKVKRLIFAQDGVDENAVGRKITGALHHAVRDEDFSTARTLLQHAELNPNHIDDMDWTPLCHATYNGDLAMVELLLLTREENDRLIP